MLRRSRREDLLIERFWAALRGDRKAAPPPELDPRLVVVLQRLEDEVQPPEPADAFVQQLWRTLDSRADELNLRDTTTTSTRAWSGPAVDFNSKRPARPAPAAEPEDQIMTASTDQPVSLEKRRLSKELWKIAAAIAIFALVGAVLVLLLRDNDDEPTMAAPVSTATTLASPSSDVTATIDPTRQAAIIILTTSADAHASDATATAGTFATANASLPSPGNTVASITVGNNPIGLASTEGALWVTNAGDGTVSRIDPATNAVVATIEVPDPFGDRGGPFHIASHDGQVWVTVDGSGTLIRIDPSTNQIEQTIPLLTADGSGTFDTWGLLVDDSGIWVSDYDGGRFVHLDPETGSVIATVDVVGSLYMTAGFGSIWVASEGSGSPSIMRIDPTSHAIIATVEITGLPDFVASGLDAVWVSDERSGTVTRIDPETNTVAATIDTGLREARFVLVAQDKVWVNGWLGTGFDNGMLTIDPATNALSRFIDTVPGISWYLAEFDGSIWAAHADDDEVVRIDPAP